MKYVEWHRSVSAPLEQKTVPVVPYYGGFTTTQTLPFFEANYKIQPSWSTYFQFAKGIYVPDISAFENATPLLASQAPKAQTTTNYQFGMVYYADNWTFDGDLITSASTTISPSRLVRRQINPRPVRSIPVTPSTRASKRRHLCL